MSSRGSEENDKFNNYLEADPYLLDDIDEAGQRQNVIEINQEVESKQSYIVAFKDKLNINPNLLECCAEEVLQEANININESLIKTLSSVGAFTVNSSKEAAELSKNEDLV